MEMAWRFGVFLAVLIIMLVWETWANRRPWHIARPKRWLTNLGLVVLNGVALRLLIPAGAVGSALWAESEGIGLFNWLALPEWLAILLVVVLLDFAIYVQHAVFHHVPLLWRLHRVHHADVDIDVTTGIRFHPIEIMLSMLIKMSLVVALGAPVVSVILFEILLNASALFNHANVRLPVTLDHWLRRLIVTPDMHRVHHSTIRAEHDSNFGFFLSVWDRWFGTYRAQPEAGHDNMQIGLSYFRARKYFTLMQMLLMPFKRQY